MRQRLSYSNVMATLAFFFALTGAATAGVKYLAVGSPAGGHLTGTYPDPEIAPAKLMSAFINFQGIVLYASTPGITAELYDPTLSDALYRVHFPVETPQKCMPVVTPTYFNGTGRTATVDTAGGDFVVETYSSDTGARSPNSFSIIISC